MKKNIISVLSVLLAGALLCACATAGAVDSGPVNAPQTDPAPAAGVFDPDLAGVWKLYSRWTADTEGRYLFFDLLRRLDFILDDGTVSGIYAGFGQMVGSGIVPMALHTDSGRVDLIDQMRGFYDRIAAADPTQDFSGITGLLSSMENVNVNYQIFDLTGDTVTSPGVVTVPGPVADLLSAFEKDGLCINITGDYRGSDGDRQINESYFFYKDGFYIDEYTEAYLYGSWLDDKGNTWQFSYAGGGNAQYRYTMTEADGTVHTGRDLLCEGVLTTDSGDRLCRLGAVTFGFEDLTSPSYEITEKSMDRLVLHGGQEDLILTRQP